MAVASTAPIDAAAIAARLTERGTDWDVITGPELVTWVGDAEVLTDDYAPVDQLLTPYASAVASRPRVPCRGAEQSVVSSRSLGVSPTPGTHLAAFSSVALRLGSPPSSALRCTHLNAAKRQGIPTTRH